MKPLLVTVLSCKLTREQRVASALAQVRSVLGSCDTIVIDGLIGTDSAVDDLYAGIRGAIQSKRRPTRPEIAVYGTHRMAWRSLLESDSDYALVLEDDFKFSDSALVQRCAESIAALMSDGRNVIKLFDFPRRNSGGAHIGINVNDISLVKWQRPRAGMVAYFISREGAKRYLARDRIFRAVDEDVKYYWELGLDVWSVSGNSVAECSEELGGSSLDEHRENSRQRSILRSIHGLALSGSRDVQNRLAFFRYCKNHGYGLEATNRQ